MAEHVFEQLIFHFRNGDEWTVEHDELADVWISRVTTSYGRIHGGQIQEIHPCKSFKVEILPEADHVKSSDINTGSLEMGMFGRATKYQDIEKMDLVFNAEDKSAFKSTSHSSKRIQAGLITSTRVASLQQTVIFIL